MTITRTSSSSLPRMTSLTDKSLETKPTVSTETRHDSRRAPVDSFLGFSLRRDGTADDSIGRGTADDSIGRGTADDSIGGDQSMRADGRLTPTWKGPFSNLTVAELKAEMSADLVARLDAGLSDPTRQGFLTGILKSAQFEKLDPAQREQLLDMALNASNAQVSRMVLIALEHGVDLAARGSDGRTILDNLSELSASHETLARSLLGDLAKPARIFQGNAPTCAASAVQHEFARRLPADYVRVVSELALDGQSTLPGGDLVTTSFRNSQLSNKRQHKGLSASEALFQPAMMDYADGADVKYDLFAQTHSDGRRGLYADEIGKLLSQVFDEPYKTMGVNLKGAALVLETLEAGAADPVLMNIKLDPTATTNHCVAFTRCDDSTVWVRDPQTGAEESYPRKAFLLMLQSIQMTISTD